jgi:hypothetical protein
VWTPFLRADVDVSVREKLWNKNKLEYEEVWLVGAEAFSGRKWYVIERGTEYMRPGRN